MRVFISAFHIACAISVVLCVIVSPLLSQPLIHSSHRYGENLAITNSSSASDGSIVNCGYFEGSNIRGFIEKINTQGKVSWARSMKLQGWPIYLTAVRTLEDGSVVAAGNKGTQTVSSPIVLRFSPDGELLWTRNYWSIGYGSTYGLCPTNDGGFIITGSNGRGFIFKTDSQGTPLWCKYGQSNGEFDYILYYSAVEASDSTIIVGGTLQLRSTSKKVPIQWGSVIRLSPAGMLINQQSLHSQTDNIILTWISKQSEDSYLLGGSSQPVSGSQVPLLLTLSGTGSVSSGQTVNFFASERICNFCTSAGGTTVGLTCSNVSSDTTAHLFSIDIPGAVARAAVITGRAPLFGTLVSLNNGNTLGLGMTVKDSQQVSEIDFLTVDASLHGCDIANTLCITSAAIISDTAFAPSIDSAEIKFEPLALDVQPLLSEYIVRCSTISEVEKAFPIESPVFYPNPVVSNRSLTVIVPKKIIISNLILRDATGREVYRTRRDATSAGEQIQIPTAGLGSGVYTVELLDASSFANVWRGKVVVE